MKKLAELNMAMIEVPGDGNCLLWALLVHQRCISFDHVSLEGDCSDSGNVHDMKELRAEISKEWLLVKDDPGWQSLFALVNDDFIDAPATPVRKKEVEAAAPLKPQSQPDNPVGIDGIATPEKEAALKPRRVGKCNTAVASKPAETPLDLKPPSKTSQKTEPSVSLALVSKSDSPIKISKLETAAQLGQDVLADDDDCDGFRVTRKRHKRTAQKKVLSNAQVEEQAVKAYLAECGLLYPTWNSAHRSQEFSAKAALCIDGGYMRFQTAIRLGKEMKCPTCVALMEEYDVNPDNVKEAMQEALKVHTTPVVLQPLENGDKESEKHERQGVKQQGRNQQDSEQECDEGEPCDEREERDRCVLGGFPQVTFLPLSFQIDEEDRKSWLGKFATICSKELLLFPGGTYEPRAAHFL